MTLKSLNISKDWTLFLDRDGVINRRLVDDYVKTWDEFEFIDGVLDAIKIFSETFSRIFIVTNQRGVGKGLMEEETLNGIHQRMTDEISNAGGKIDRVYFCPALKSSNSFCRKPNVGMGVRAKRDFPGIMHRKSIMAGDSLSDMQFGKRLKMKTVLIGDDHAIAQRHPALLDFHYNGLIDFANQLSTL